MLLLQDYEPVEWVRPREGEAFIDVGGYIGSYSICAAKTVGTAGRVVILEPESNNRRQLDKNLGLNGITNCKELPLAAWLSSGSVGWHQAAHPVWHRVEAGQNDQAVAAVSVDDLVRRLFLSRADWIKMDVERTEVDSLKGAENTLVQFHPQLFIEVHETLRRVTELFSKFGDAVVSATFDLGSERHGWVLARAS